jgi:hypothetical protein
MGPERRAQVESLCLEALSKDARKRAAFLDEACRDDRDLRRQVDSLLAGRVEADALLQTPSSLAPAPPLTPGTRLGPYEIQSFIGAGGMGQVYKAQQRATANLLAPATSLFSTQPAAAGRPGSSVLLMSLHAKVRL